MYLGDHILRKCLYILGETAIYSIIDKYYYWINEKKNDVRNTYLLYIYFNSLKRKNLKYGYENENIFKLIN